MLVLFCKIKPECQSDSCEVVALTCLYIERLSTLNHPANTTHLYNIYTV